MEDQEPDKPTTLEAAFREELNTHGHGFHHAMLTHIREQHSISWRVEATEFPVAFRGGTTHIDFVLRHARVALMIVAECKRANPSLCNWCFIREPHSAAGEVSVDEVRFNLPTSGAVVARARGISSSADQICTLGFPIKGKQKGDRTGDGRDVINKAVAQVLRGANGLTEFLAHERALLDGRANNKVGRVLPAIFTTANLWVSDLDLGASDLAEGTVPLTKLRSVPWLWLTQNISPDLQHSLPLVGSGSRASLQDYVVADYARTIAIVGVSGVAGFLERAAQFDF